MVGITQLFDHWIAEWKSLAETSLLSDLLSQSHVEWNAILALNRLIFTTFFFVEMYWNRFQYRLYSIITFRLVSSLKVKNDRKNRKNYNNNKKSNSNRIEFTDGNECFDDSTYIQIWVQEYSVVLEAIRNNLSEKQSLNKNDILKERNNWHNFVSDVSQTALKSTKYYKNCENRAKLALN